MRRSQTAVARTSTLAREVSCVLLLATATLRPVLAQEPAPAATAAPQTSPSPGEVASQPLLPYPADEDWSFVRNSKTRYDPFDGIKFIPIDDKGNYISLGGEERIFYEAFANEKFGAIPGSDSYVESRTVLHADLHPDANLRSFVSFQSTGLGNRPGGPRPAVDKDAIDLLEGFAEYHSTGDAKLDTNGTLVRVGRQQLDFGSGRLFSGRAGPDGEGPNVLGSFDGVRTAVRSNAWRVDVFAARPVNNELGAFDDGPSAGNGTWGAYATRGGTGLATTGAIDAYYFGVDRPDAVWYSGSGYETRHTVGVRFWKHGAPTDYDLETFYQFGKNGSRSISAEGIEAQVGHTFAGVPLAPRLGVLAGYNSGGGDARSERDMYPPFPRGGYFGNLRAIGPQNTFATESELDLNPTSTVEISAGSYLFLRSNITDGIYNLDGSELAPPRNGSRYIGYQPFVTAIWHASAHLTFVLDHESFQRGSFLMQTPKTVAIHYTAAWIEFRI